jgi:hypothetical protein
MFLRKNTASQTICFGLVNSSTGAALAGATVTVRRCLDGTFAATTGSVTEDSGGLYKFAPSQADTNGDQVAYFFTATSAIPVCLNARTTAADMADSVRFGLTALPNAAAAASGGLPTVGTGSGQITLASGLVSANTTQLAGQTVTAGAGVTFPTSIASPTNITAATGITVSTNSDKTGYSLTATTGLGNQTSNITGNLSGSVGSVTGAVGSVTGAVGSVTGAVGSVTGNVGGNVTGSVGSVATGGVTAASFAAGAINAAAIAADAIGASELAADAIAEIADAVWDEARSGHTTAGTFGLYLDAQVSTVGGGSLTEAGIADAVWDEVLSGHLTGGSTGNALNAAGSAGDPWSTTLPGAYSAGSAGYIIGNQLDAAVSTRSTYAGADTSGTTTLLSRLSSARAGYLDNLSGGAVALASGVIVTTNNDKTGYSLVAGTGLGNQISNITGNLSGSVGSVTGAVGSVTGAVGSVTSTVSLNLAQTLSAARNVSAVADTSLTLNDALHLAIAGAAGQETVVGTTYTVKSPSTATVLRIFTLDSGSAPTSRT